MRRGPRKRAPAALLAVSALTLGACVVNHGARAEYGRAVDSAHGERFRFWIRMGAEEDPMQIRTAELLEVRDSALLIAFDDRIVHVALDRIALPEIEDPESYRMRARYPRRLTHLQVRALLDAAGVERIDTLPSLGVAGGGPAAAATAQDGGYASGPMPRADHRHPPDPGTLAAFLREARSASAAYRSLERAVADGYRRLGPSFPGMGEHWIHPGLIVAGRVEADRPPVLCYVRVDGEPRLVALAFTVPLEGDEAPPAYPAGPDIWHDHSDHVDEETLLLSHPGSHHGSDGPRLAMFHAWLWLDNVDGDLAQNNWRLPFLQAGLDVARLNPSDQAARGLSLHTSGPAYYLALFRAAARPDPAETRALEQLLEAGARSAETWVRARGAQADSAALAELEALWDGFWAAVERVVRPRTRRALSVLR